MLILPVFVHLPELLGVLSSNPLPILSGLAVHPTNWLDGAVLPGLPGWIDGNAGVTVQALGRLVARDWWHGVVPWWNPYSGVGAPLAGEFQPAAFFLPFVFLLGLPNGLLLLKLTLQVVGGVSMAALLRALGMVPAAALLGGILFEFNGCFAWMSDSPMLPVAFLPLMLLGVERARTGRWRVLALGIAWTVLAGFPETAFLEGLLALAWAALRIAQAQDPRWRLALAVALGGIAGLLLTSPQLVAFLDYLPDAFLGSHAKINDTALPAAGWAMFLFPYLNGTVLFGGRTTLWYSLVGYVGLSTALLAAIGCFGRRDRALRLMLVAWIALSLLKVGDLRAVAMVLDALPLVGRTWFFRYATPAWMTASIVLAAFALDDWYRGEPRQTQRVVAGGVIAALLAALALLADRHVLTLQQALPGGRIYALAALAWGSAVALLLMAALAGAATAWRKRALGGLLIVDAMVLFAVPLLSGRTDTAVDRATVAFLRERLGLQRFLTTGPIVPNYGAYYGLASIDHNMMPVPQAWIDRIHQTLDPHAEAVTFDGLSSRSPNGEALLLRLLQTRPEAFESLGVAYVLVSHGSQRPGSIGIATGSPTSAEALTLEPGGHLTVIFRAEGFGTLPVENLDVVVGTSGGLSDGVMAADFCSRTFCGHGETPLAHAANDAALAIRLNRDVPIGDGDEVTVVLSHRGGTMPVAIWLARGSGAAPARLDPPHDSFVPLLYLSAAATLPLVRSGISTDIYALPAPAPYFEAVPQCNLSVQSRRHVAATCDAPATLIRRELFLPGWNAAIDGTRTALSRQKGIFQALTLPAGRSTVEFWYAPPHVLLGWSGLLVGLLMLGLPRAGRAWRAFRSRSA